jgi:hypothetical protein
VVYGRVESNCDVLPQGMRLPSGAGGLVACAMYVWGSLLGSPVGDDETPAAGQPRAHM